jgi:hypothetical protein
MHLIAADLSLIAEVIIASVNYSTLMLGSEMVALTLPSTRQSISATIQAA